MNTLSDRQLAELVAVTRALYPHPGLPDAPYERVATIITKQAGEAPELADLLRGGLDDLSPWILYKPDAGPAALEARLRAIQGTAFFRTLRPLVAFHLYDDEQVRAHLGYPGASYDQGGYLHRGFDDLDWLPDPRIEEPPEPLIEIGPLPYPVARA